MKNLSNIEITRPHQELILMRGISGCGKSTEALKLVGDGMIFSADTELLVFGDYNEVFTQMKATGNMSLLGKAHHACATKSFKAMKDGITPVIIDNTNLKPNDAKIYVVNALKLGFSQDNIKIIDLGTNGFSAEELAKRNTHSVSVEIIRKMIQRHKSTSPITLKQILDSKDRNLDSDILYSAVVIDEGTRNSLKFKFEDEIPSNWVIMLHHMTIRLGGLKNKSEIGKLVTLTVTHIGISEMAMAIRVSGYESKNEFPHITVAINPDGKPVMSNEITTWRQVKEFNINGIVTEIKKTV